jgi:hypothetical protein
MRIIITDTNVFFDMMDIEVLPPSGKDGAVKGAGNERRTAIVNTQAEAIKIAKEIAINQKSEVVIHGTNGRIRVKDSYGNDPMPPKDKKK